jgi:PAS domain S-box-containing protein
MAESPDGDTDLRAMLDALPERIARYRLDDLRVLYCNAAKAAQYGLTSEQLIGRQLSEVLPGPDIARIRKHLSQLDHDHREVTMVGALETDGAETRWIEWIERWVPGRDGPEVLSVGRDITERHRDQQRLHESEQRFRLAMDDAPIGMALVDMQGRFIEVNGALCDFLGRAEDDLLQLTTLDVTHPDDVGDDLAYAQAAAHGWDPPELRKRYVRPGGDVVDGLLKVSTVTDPSGRPSYVISQVVDISEQVAHQRRLEQAAATERQAADQLRRLDEVKNSFLNAVSHELRTPLTVVRGMAATLVRVGAALDGETRSELERAIERHATVLSQLLDELLDVDRLARGTLTIDQERTDVAGIVRGMIAASDVRDRIRIHTPAELWVDVDAVQVGRIVSNLLENAAKYAPDGPVEVRLTEPAPGAMRLEVIDRGPGIAAEERNRVFEPFYRGKNDHPQPGTGIGLALVAEFARLHGGHAWVEPSDRGAHLIVALPGVSAGPEAP